MINNSIEDALNQAIVHAKASQQGKPANYIPELASVTQDYLAVAVKTLDGKEYVATEHDLNKKFTLQSTAKLIPLIGLLEEFGHEQVFSWVNTEPSGHGFASLAYLDQFGPKPANPLLNSGAIVMCNHIPGETQEEKFSWLDRWTERLFNKKLSINTSVFASERRTGDRNRALGYLLKSTGNLQGRVKQISEYYFYLCSYEASVEEAMHLPFILANQGKNAEGEQVISRQTAQQVVAIMATCGLYNESGAYMVHAGIPAKSGVSGYILATAIGHAGIAVICPKVNDRGNSIRGKMVLEYLSKALSWHFAWR